jgi:hypothetical protein
VTAPSILSDARARALKQSRHLVTGKVFWRGGEWFLRLQGTGHSRGTRVRVEHEKSVGVVRLDRPLVQDRENAFEIWQYAKESA